MRLLKKIALTISIITTTSTLLISQDFDKVYFNSNWVVTAIDNAVYYRKSGFNSQIPSYADTVTDYYLNNDQIEMIGQYVNGLKSGIFNFYYPDGKLKMVANYKENERFGNWKEFYHNGVLKLHTEYEGDIEKIIELNDSLGNSLLKQNKLKYNLVYSDVPSHFTEVNSLLDDVTYEISGTLNQTVRDGKWTVRKGKQIHASLTYSLGKMEKGFFYTKGQKTPLYNKFAFPLIVDPIKFLITERFALEPGAIIKNNYITQGLHEYKYKSMKKLTIKSYEDLKQYLNDHFELRSKTVGLIKIRLETNNGRITNFSTEPTISTYAEKDLRLLFETIEKIEFDWNKTITLEYKVEPTESIGNN